MVTQNFAWSGSSVFLTGVVYTDTDSNNFYSVGEGVSGTRVIVGPSNALTAVAGGYALALAGGTGVVAVRVEAALSVLELILDLSAGNAKLDVIGETAIATSVDTVLQSGISHATLLGWANLSLTGSAASEVLTGNFGANHILGGDGNDTIFGGDFGDDVIGGGAGNDTVRGGIGNDTIYGGLGDDNIGGGAGDDVIFASAGANTIWGGLGNDTLHGGTGRDVMSGGPGADVFVFASAAHIGIL